MRGFIAAFGAYYINSNMRSLSLLIILLTTTLFACAQTPSENSLLPADWKSVDVCGMTFEVPKAFEKLKVKGIDSCLAGFEADGISMSLVFVWHDSPLQAKGPEYKFKEEKLEIDGKRAQIATYTANLGKPDAGFLALLYLVGKERTKDDPTTTTVNMSIQVKKESDLETAKKIFKSIRFNKPS